MIVCSNTIRQDKEGRYRLNDLHKASGGEKRHSPSYWLDTQQTAGLIDLLNTTGKAVVSIEGRNGGTYVCKELVYSYAMWISPEFSLQVIRAYDALAAGQVNEAKRIASRERAKLESPILNESIKVQREKTGKPVRHYLFSNEYDMINRIALGMTAKQYRERHGLDKAQPIRDHLTKCEIECIEHLQRVNSSLIDIGMDFDSRKCQLNKLYMTHHYQKLLAEVVQLES